MKTTLEQSTVLYHLINASPLKAAITGDVYKDWRPDDSVLEDIVINAIIIDNDLIQAGVANVNIHVPAIDTAGGKMPNSGRMEVLARIACDFLKSGTNEKYTFHIENQTTIKEIAANEWFVNIRIRFNFHNTIN